MMTDEQLKKKQSCCFNSLQVLIKPVGHVRQGLLRALDSSCIIVVVSQSPSMRNSREDLDKVSDLHSPKNIITGHKLHKKKYRTATNLSHDYVPQISHILGPSAWGTTIQNPNMCT